MRDTERNLSGFIGRSVRDSRWPKYKNPPATHTYEKSVNLYQPLPAPRRSDGHIIVVEGTLDAMAIAVAAFVLFFLCLRLFFGFDIIACFRMASLMHLKDPGHGFDDPVRYLPSCTD